MHREWRGTDFNFSEQSPRARRMRIVERLRLGGELCCSTSSISTVIFTVSLTRSMDFCGVVFASEFGETRAPRDAVQNTTALENHAATAHPCGQIIHREDCPPVQSSW